MRYLILLVCCFLLSCASQDVQRNLLNPANLSSFYVNVDHSKDQLIRTPKGAVVFIKSNTFQTNVELEIKEAYTMKDMLLAGLRTESNGKPLKSGGMIYINTRNGETISLKQSISILIPASYIDSSMSLFKGAVMKDSSINWLPTDTLQPTVASERIQAGKTLFVNNCSSCHAIKKDVAAPALAGLEKRGVWKNHKEILRWISNPALYMANDKSGYTISLKNKFGVMMPAFPQLRQKEIDNLVAFINNEEKQQVTDTFRLPYNAIEKPCNGFDTVYFNERDTMRVTDEEVEILIDTAFDSNTKIDVDNEGMRNGFTDVQNSNGAYRFGIKTLGWYNVDASLEPQPNTYLCDLKVVVKDAKPETAGLTVYAFFPKNKNLSVGAGSGNGSFYFDKVNNKIPLYLGETGVIVAFGNLKEQFFYGSKMFTVQKTQTISVIVSPTTKEQFLNSIKAEQLEGIDFDVIKQQMQLVPCDGVSDTTAAK